MFDSPSNELPSGKDQVFQTTHWSVVLQAGSVDSTAALEQLCRVYWPPLLAFLRGQGYNPHEAEDLLQGFFERFLAKEYLHEVSREKGRFRSFLLASLRHFAANERRHARTVRRGGGSVVLDIHDPAVIARCETAIQTERQPEVVYDRVWATTVMRTAAARLQTEYQGEGKAGLYQTICLWLAQEARPGDYAAAAPSLGLSEGALAVAVHRLRQRFRQIVRTEVAQTVQSPAEVDEEMRYLLEVLTAS